MLIVYASKTGNTERFVHKLQPLPSLKVKSGQERVSGPCVLLTYTTGFGEVPAEVMHFALQNRAWIRAVAASGNRNWGSRFGHAADVLSVELGVPVLMKFELSGRPADALRFMEGVKDLE